MNHSSPFAVFGNPEDPDNSMVAIGNPEDVESMYFRVYNSKTLKVWCRNGTLYAGGLGRMHHQDGLPIEVSLQCCKEYGLVPGLLGTVYGLQECGMSEEKAVNKVLAALNEVDLLGGVPESWDSEISIFKDWFKQKQSRQNGT